MAEQPGPACPLVATQPQQSFPPLTVRSASTHSLGGLLQSYPGSRPPSILRQLSRGPPWAASAALYSTQEL